MQINKQTFWANYEMKQNSRISLSSTWGNKPKIITCSKMFIKWNTEREMPQRMITKGKKSLNLTWLAQQLTPTAPSTSEMLRGRMRSSGTQFTSWSLSALNKTPNNLKLPAREQALTWLYATSPSTTRHAFLVNVIDGTRKTRGEEW